MSYYIFEENINGKRVMIGIGVLFNKKVYHLGFKEQNKDSFHIDIIPEKLLTEYKNDCRNIPSRKRVR